MLESVHESTVGTLQRVTRRLLIVSLLLSLLWGTLNSVEAAGDATAAAENGTSTDAGSTPPATSSSAHASSWQMKPVRSFAARIQADAPIWDDVTQSFNSKFGHESYEASFDTINLASVEGALMYVQAEGIPFFVTKRNCKRKSGMQYVVFYEIELAQSLQSMAHFHGNRKSGGSPFEYGPFVAMDRGKCTPAGRELPRSCLLYFGGQDLPNLGAYAGAGKRHNDRRAPYPETYWLSFPGSCVMHKWGQKTPECRAKYPGGLCPKGVRPDGISCMWSYNIVGYLDLDDLTGIHAMIDSRTKEPYASYRDFCTDKDGMYGGVEYMFHEKKTLPFWEDGRNATRNSLRAQEMVQRYNHLATHEDPRMAALPSLDELSQKNPPCYLNVAACASTKVAPLGCRRELYTQLCRKCYDKEDLQGCILPPQDFSFPDLTALASARQQA